MASSTFNSLCSPPRLSPQNCCTAATLNPAPFGVSFTFRSRAATALRVSNAPLLRLQAYSTRQLKADVVTKRSWDKLITDSEVPVLVEFYASWCGPCRMVHRIMDEFAEEYAGKIKCFVLNTDEDLEIAEDYEIKAVPVVLFFKNGKKRESIVGTMPKDFYVAAIKRIMES